MALLFEDIKSNPADWVMVAITIISAIVAVIACVYSRKAHELSKKEAEEAKKEFEHTQKLSLMPYLLIENIPFTKKRNGFDYVILYENDPLYVEPLKLEVCFRITNVGKNIAKNISYRWIHRNQINPQYISSLPVNGRRTICVHFVANPYGNNLDSPTIAVQYMDLEDRLYEQIIHFALDIRKDSISFINISTEAPKEK